MTQFEPPEVDSIDLDDYIDNGDDADECDCDGLPGDVPCFECYLNDGAEFPAEGLTHD